MLVADDFSRPDRLIVSGAVHYFRTLPEQWPHRLRVLRAMGANCVETYVPWNLHERTRGRFDFAGIADLERFLTDADAAGLAAIVRPGPYICAEWENGGLPAWLRAANPHAPLRCADPAYLAAVDAWFAELVPRIARHQADTGNVIAVQIENEYGSYGSDTDYLNHLADRLREHGVTVPLFTSDGPTDAMLTGGTVDGALATVNFGSDPAGAFATLDRHRPGEKKWCMEYWNGWFDHWGEHHHVREAAEAAAVLDDLLTRGASVNIYMAHGGTNFGTWSGANHTDGRHLPTVTSYDYDAPIDESGAPTPKFHAFREVIARHLPVPDTIPEAAPRLPAGRVEFTESVALREWADRFDTVTAAVPPTFERLGLDNGLVRYTHRWRGPRETDTVSVDGLADRAHVFLDGEPLMLDGQPVVLERDGRTSFPFGFGEPVRELELLVESRGRVNYGPRVGELKGLVGGVRHRGQYLHGWTATPIRLDDVSTVPWTGEHADAAGPRLYRGRLRVESVGDAYVALPGWSAGYLWVNGFCLGRHRADGPQRTLYLPWPLLSEGDNEVVVLELDSAPEDRFVEIRDEPDLG